MHGFGALGARAPQGRSGHPFPQRLPAHRKTILGQMFGGQRGPEIRYNADVAAPKSSAPTALPACGSRAGPVVRDQGSIPALTQSAATFAAPGCRSLSAAPPARCVSSSPYLVQHPHSSRSRWFKPMRSVSIGLSATLETGHFYLCTNRTFSLCGDTMNLSLCERIHSR